MPARRRTQRGFTLIEMVVATVLLAIGVVAAVSCIAAASRSTGISHEYATAAGLAQARFAELHADTSSIATGEQSGDFGSTGPGYTWKQSVDTTDYPETYKITLTVEWQSGTRQRSASYQTYEVVTSASSTSSTSTSTSSSSTQ